MGSEKRLHWFLCHLIFILSSGPAFALWLIFDNMNWSIGDPTPYGSKAVTTIFGFFFFGILLGFPAALLTAIASNSMRNKYNFAKIEWIAFNLFFGSFISLVYASIIGITMLGLGLPVAATGFVAALIASLLIIYIERRMNRQK